MPTPPETFDVTLVASRMLAPAVREMVLERSDGKPFLYEPGQWLNLLLDLPDGQLKRAYSIASEPTGSARFEVAVTRVTGGPGSIWLHELAHGARLAAIGPYGLFTRQAADVTPSLFVATGTGITPLRSMIRASRASRSSPPLWVLFGARKEEDVLYGDELEAMVREDPRCRYEVTLSQPSDAWQGRRGYVQAHVPELYRALAENAHPAQADIYICGLQRMVQAVKELAQGELAVPRKQVHVERYD
jgi:ferredoxin-NADP reductase